MKLLYEVFTVIESAAFIGFLYTQINNQNVRKYTLAAGILLFCFNVLYPYFTATDLQVIDSIPIGIETIIILVFSFYYLYEKTNDTTTLYIYSIFPFWVVLGMVIYLSGCFFIYLFAAKLTQEEVNTYWPLTNLLGLLKNLLFTIAIIVNSKPPKKLPPAEFEFSSSLN